MPAEINPYYSKRIGGPVSILGSKTPGFILHAAGDKIVAIHHQSKFAIEATGEHANDQSAHHRISILDPSAVRISHVPQGRAVMEKRGCSVLRLSDGSSIVVSPADASRYSAKAAHMEDAPIHTGTLLHSPDAELIAQDLVSYVLASKIPELDRQDARAFLVAALAKMHKH